MMLFWKSAQKKKRDFEAEILGQLKLIWEQLDKLARDYDRLNDTLRDFIEGQVQLDDITKDSLKEE